MEEVIQRSVPESPTAARAFVPRALTINVSTIKTVVWRRFSRTAGQERVKRFRFSLS
jgi:hypothetical protein